MGIERVIDDVFFTAKGGDFFIRDANDDSYCILTPPLVHPYCSKAEDGFIVARANNLWEKKFQDVPVLMYLRNDRTFSLKTLRFTLDLAMKRIGVRSCIVSEDPLFRDFICSPPNVDDFDSAIVVRPFNPVFFW